MQDDNHAWTEDDLEFRKAFRDIPIDEIREARANAEYYARLVKSIHDRIRKDPVEYEKFLKLLEATREDKSSSPE